jgi:sugar fermentation stimulation protein A
MRFPAPLVRATLLRRYKRFLADVTLDDGPVVTVHCPNSGAMLGLDAPGVEVWLSSAANPKRKHPWTWELVREGDTLVGINTGHPNALAAEAIAAGTIPELAGYATLRREVKYGRNSRIDLLLEDPERPPCYVEVKNVHLKRGIGPDTPAEFPDCVTARGAKHLVELADMVAAGGRAVMLYLAQRDDVGRFALAADIDPAYAAGLRLARAAGVEALAYRCRVALDGIAVTDRLEFRP